MKLLELLKPNVSAKKIEQDHKKILQLHISYSVYEFIHIILFCWIFVMIPIQQQQSLSVYNNQRT